MPCWWADHHRHSGIHAANARLEFPAAQPESVKTCSADRAWHSGAQRAQRGSPGCLEGVAHRALPAPGAPAVQRGVGEEAVQPACRKLAGFKVQPALHSRREQEASPCESGGAGRHGNCQRWPWGPAGLATAYCQPCWTLQQACWAHLRGLAETCRQAALEGRSRCLGLTLLPTGTPAGSPGPSFVMLGPTTGLPWTL